MLLLSIALKMEWQMVGGFGPQSMPEADPISKTISHLSALGLAFGGFAEIWRLME